MKISELEKEYIEKDVVIVNETVDTIITKLKIYLEKMENEHHMDSEYLDEQNEKLVYARKEFAKSYKVVQDLKQALQLVEDLQKSELVERGVNGE